MPVIIYADNCQQLDQYVDGLIRLNDPATPTFWRGTTPDSLHYWVNEENTHRIDAPDEKLDTPVWLQEVIW